MKLSILGAVGVGLVLTCVDHSGAATYEVNVVEVQEISNPGGLVRLVARTDHLPDLSDLVVQAAYLEFQSSGSATAVSVVAWPLTRWWGGFSCTWTSPWMKPGGDFDAGLPSRTLIPAQATIARVDVVDTVRSIAEGLTGTYGFLLSVPEIQGAGFTPAEKTALSSLSTGKLVVKARNLTGGMSQN